jgi:hypothetical protein
MVCSGFNVLIVAGAWACLLGNRGQSFCLKIQRKKGWKFFLTPIGSHIGGLIRCLTGCPCLQRLWAFAKKVEHVRTKCLVCGLHPGRTRSLG